MKYPRNNFDPGSQPWARAVEKKLNDLEGLGSSLGSKQSNSARGMAATLTKLSQQVGTLEQLVAEQPVILRAAFMASSTFALTNTSYVTRETASIQVPDGAKFAILLGNVTLNSSSSGAPSATQIVEHQMVLTKPLTGGGSVQTIMNQFPSLIMPSNAGAPVIVTSGGPLSGFELVDNVPNGGNLTFEYQTRAAFSSYIGTADVTANIFALFFYRPVTS